jgi:hypothetical protein
MPGIMSGGNLCVASGRSGVPAVAVSQETESRGTCSYTGQQSDCMRLTNVRVQVVEPPRHTLRHVRSREACHDEEGSLLGVKQLGCVLCAKLQIHSANSQRWMQKSHGTESSLDTHPAWQWCWWLGHGRRNLRQARRGGKRYR